MTDELKTHDLVPHYFKWTRERREMGGEEIPYGRLREHIALFLKQEGWDKRPLLIHNGFYQTVSALEEIVRKLLEQRSKVVISKAKKKRKDESDKARQLRLSLKRR